MPAVLRALQGGLESMYRVETELDVCDFLVGGEQRDALQVERAPREQLLIRRDDDGLQLGLFVDERTLENLAMRDPRRRLDAQNLQDFLLAVEGVSHFVYLVHRARQERPVSAVELELQAEVDKYVTCLLHDVDTSAALRGRLFEDCVYEHDLDSDERERYRVANDNAHRYTAFLEEEFVAPRRIPEMLGELRRFYRQGLAGKLETIARAA